jgi:hypothetical protein
MAKHLAYTHASDRRSGTYTGDGLTALGSQYPFSALGTTEPAEVFMANETTGRMVFNAGAKVDIKAVLLGHHRFAAGLTLRLEANDDNDWTGTQDLEQDVLVPAWRKDGFARNVWWDLETRLPNAADRSWTYWSLRPMTANDAAIAAGLFLFFTAIRRLGRNIGWNVEHTTDHDEIRNSTKFSVESVYEPGSRARGCSATVPQANDATRLAIEDWREDARSGNRAFFVSPAGEEAAADLLTEPHWVQWTGGPLAVQWNYLDLHQVRLQFKELGCGLPF